MGEVYMQFLKRYSFLFSGSLWSVTTSGVDGIQASERRNVGISALVCSMKHLLLLLFY